MRLGVDVTGLGSYADAAVVAEVARVAEGAGWDAVFVWDHIGWALGMPGGDPWVSLAAAASATTRITLGVGVAAVPRHRPHLLATTTTALDRLSGGRLVFGAGLGGTEAEFDRFGEESSASVRAAKLDEALLVLDRLWRGDRVSHKGEHHTVDDLVLAPLPHQRPRPPVWIGGTSARALQRAARWDGYAAGPVVDERGAPTVSPEELARRVAVIDRPSDFDVAVVGVSEPGDDAPRRYADAGATWWLESIHDGRGTLPEMLDRLRAGP